MALEVVRLSNLFTCFRACSNTFTLKHSPNEVHGHEYKL